MIQVSTRSALLSWTTSTAMPACRFAAWPKDARFLADQECVPIHHRPLRSCSQVLSLGDSVQGRDGLGRGHPRFRELPEVLLLLVRIAECRLQNSALDL